MLIPRARDEELDAENVAALLHGQDLPHPRTDPLEVFEGLNDPDECDAASGHGAGRVAGHQVPDVGHLVGDTDASGEEEHGTIGGHRSGGTVGSFDQSFEGQFGAIERPCFFGACVQSVGETGAATDDGGDGGGFRGMEILVRHGEATGFFGGIDAAAERCSAFVPGDGERVRGPHADRWDGDVDMLTRSNLPWPCNVEGDAKSIAGKCFDGGLCAATSNVAVGQIPEPETAIEDPGCNGSHKERLLRHARQVHPESDE